MGDSAEEDEDGDEDEAEDDEFAEGGVAGSVIGPGALGAAEVFL